MRKYVWRIGCILAGTVLLSAVVWNALPDSASAGTDTSGKSPAGLVLSACTPSGTADTSVRLDVPYLSQEAYPTGCESVSAVMTMQYWGIDIDVDTFIDQYLDCGAITKQGDTLIGPSPNDRFVGNPRESTSYGCYAPVIERAMEKILPDGYSVVNRSGAALASLAQRYLDRQIPILIWATIDMKAAYPSATWVNEADGTTVQWISNEHCMVLVGYDDDYYFCNDPYENNGTVRYSRELLENRFVSMGSQALVVVKD